MTELGVLFLIFILLVIILMVILGFVIFRYENGEDGGRIVVTKDELTGKMLFSLELDKSPEEIAQMKKIVFTVTDNPEIAE